HAGGARGLNPPLAPRRSAPRPGLTPTMRAQGPPCVICYTLTLRDPSTYCLKSMPVTTIEERGQTTDELGARMLDATITCLARFGVAKTTIDDVAREAGCSRATVYRYHANRNALVLAAVDREIADLTAS